MRKIISLSFLPAMVLILAASCTKQSADHGILIVPPETLTLKVAPNEAGAINLPDAGTLNISRQASHFLVSETFLNNENNNPAYKYTPTKDFTGTDEVVLLSTKTLYASNNGGSCQGGNNGSTTQNKYIIIKITVGN
jgi:hypothetical protein